MELLTADTHVAQMAAQLAHEAGTGFHADSIYAELNADTLGPQADGERVAIVIVDASRAAQFADMLAQLALTLVSAPGLTLAQLHDLHLHNMDRDPVLAATEHGKTVLVGFSDVAVDLARAGQLFNVGGAQT